MQLKTQTFFFFKKKYLLNTTYIALKYECLWHIVLKPKGTNLQLDVLSILAVIFCLCIFFVFLPFSCNEFDYFCEVFAVIVNHHCKFCKI